MALGFGEGAVAYEAVYPVVDHFDFNVVLAFFYEIGDIYPVWSGPDTAGIAAVYIYFRHHADYADVYEQVLVSG